MASNTSSMPIRRATTDMSDDDAVPGQDPRDTSELLNERLRAWKHAVGYLENYVSATEKVEKAHAKEFEKILKTISDPLKEQHHFDTGLGGVQGLFENMRKNTLALSHSHAETEKNLKGSVLPILERLHKEIKSKSKELTSGAGKGAKEVDKARVTTQKHIELLGTHLAAFGSAGGKVSANDDPYVINRGVYHRLHKQILEENNNRNDLISVQNNFSSFEAHILEVVHQAMASFNNLISGQLQRDQTLYADMASASQRIPADFEWRGFVSRNGNMLIDPKSEPRSVNSVTFPNQDHAATKPLIDGTLERKSRSLLSSGYSSNYYVVTPSKYLHEFKDSDNFGKDPVPEMSIYLPDATIGSTNGAKFNVKGKDVSKGLTSKLSGSSEIAFKAASPQDAEKWFQIISKAAGSAPVAYESREGSPVAETRPVEGVTTTGITPAAGVAPTTAGTVVPADHGPIRATAVPPTTTTAPVTGQPGQAL